MHDSISRSLVAVSNGFRQQFAWCHEPVAVISFCELLKQTGLSMPVLLPSSSHALHFGAADFDILAGASSVKGVRREHNEDHEYISLQRDLFIVSDGMGGHAAGELASEFAVDSLAHELGRIHDEPHNIREVKELVRHALKEAHCLIVDLAEISSDYIGAGASVVLALVFGDHLFITGIGDSRAYRLREQRLEQLTQDDSIAGALEDAGLITHDDARHHPARHQLLSALGLKDFTTDKEIRILDLQHGDRFLLCSNGITEVLDDDELIRILAATVNAQQTADEFVRTAVEQGASDDLTAIVFTVQKRTTVADSEDTPEAGMMQRLWHYLNGE